MSARRRILVLALALSVAACDEDPPPVPTDAARRDAGDSADAGGPLDDGGSDAALDGAPSLDGGEDAGPPRGCVPGPVADVADGQLHDVALSLAAGRALVAWTETIDGRRDLFVRVEGADGALGDARNVTEGLDPPWHPRALSGPAHRLVWTATAGSLDGWDVHALEVSPDGEPGEVRRLADDADDAGDHVPSLARAGSAEHALWVRRTSSGSTGLARWPFEDGPRDDVLADVRPAGAVVGGSVGDALLWVWPEVEAGGVFVHAALEDLGTGAVGEPLVLSSAGGANAQIAVAGAVDEAAVIWEERAGTSRRLRMRLLDAEGGYESAERPVTLGARSGRTPSLVAFAGGYLGLWHESGGPAGDRAFLGYVSSNEGLLGGVGLAPVEGELVATRLVTDGRSVHAAWLERRGARASIQAVSLLCNF